MIGAVPACGKIQPAVEPGAAVIVIGVRYQVSQIVVDARQIGIGQGAGAGRGPLQVEAVGLAGLQRDLEPVDIAPGFDHTRGRVADADYPCGRGVLGIIVGHGSVRNT